MSVLRLGDPGHTVSQYRARTWLSDAAGDVDEASVQYRYLTDDGDIKELDAWVDGEVESDRANAGDVQMWVSGFGWLPYEE